jgi:O-methyltransferase
MKEVFLLTVLSGFRRVAKHVFGKLGLDVIQLPRLKAELSTHARILPGATYSPWIADSHFQDLWAKIKDYTLVDQYRCYELWQLLNQKAKLPGDVLEVGVWRGGTAALICSNLAMSGEPGMVYLADTFHGVVKAGENDNFYRNGEHADASAASVEALLKSLGLQNYQILQGIFPDETTTLLQDRCFAFCHIDVDVYQSAKDVTEWVWPRLTTGGAIVFDDYGFYQCGGVARYVDELRMQGDCLVIHNLNGHALCIKLK